jgi:hypothetical protein
VGPGRYLLRFEDAVSQFILQSVRDDCRLVLTPEGDKSFRVSMEGYDLVAAIKVRTGETIGFEEFWRDIATCSKGWSGAKRWSSLDGYFQLEATSGDHGHIVVQCQLRCGAPVGWRLRVWLFTEVGALNSLAAQASEFMQPVRPDFPIQAL